MLQGYSCIASRQWLTRIMPPCRGHACLHVDHLCMSSQRDSSSMGPFVALEDLVCMMFRLGVCLSGVCISPHADTAAPACGNGGDVTRDAPQGVSAAPACPAQALWGCGAAGDASGGPPAPCQLGAPCWHPHSREDRPALLKSFHRSLVASSVLAKGSACSPQG